jgi:hypothetical protein
MEKKRGAKERERKKIQIEKQKDGEKKRCGR